MKTINDLFKDITKAVRKPERKNEWTATIVSEGSKPWRTIVRLDNGQEMEVYNNRLATIPELKVIVGSDPTMPGQLHVLRPNDAERSWNYWVVNHHKSHEYPNHDAVWVQGAQIIPFNVLPAGAFTVTVYCDDALRGDAEWVKGTTATIDLASSVPTAGARFVLIEIDETGAIVTTDGAEVDDRYLLAFSDIPEPTAGRMPICAVALYDGQDMLRRDTRYGKRNDFVDLRWGNWNREGGSGTGTFDMAAAIHAATAASVTSASEFGFWDSVTSALRKITWANIVVALNSLYATISHTHTHNSTTSIQGGTTGEYYHLSLDEHDELTQGSLTSLHLHNASELLGGDMLKIFHLIPLSDISGGSVYAIAHDAANNMMYVGGSFSLVRGVTHRGIVRYNLTTEEWEMLGSGQNLPAGADVKAILVDGDSVYIGGDFLNADGVSTADYIVKYSIAGDSFASIGGTLNGIVYALAKLGSDIIVGGAFTNAGGFSTADYIAKYSPSGGTWASIGGSLNGDVYALAVNGTDIYVGGLFTNAGGFSTADYIAKWNGTSWSSIGGTLNSYVYALCVGDGVLYVGGQFTDANGITSADRIAQYDLTGGTWSSIPNSSPVFDGVVTALAYEDGYLYVGGIFTKAFAIYSLIEETWNTSIVDASSNVRAIVIASGRMMAGGEISTLNGEVAANWMFWILVGIGDAMAYLDNKKVNQTDFDDHVVEFDAHVANTGNPHSVTAAQAVAIPEDGWIACAETWTRTGNHTFTISGDVTAKYRKGVKVRYKDGGAFEYGVILSSSYGAPNTTITLFTNTDYAMAAVTITDKWISFVENPEDFPHDFNYTPTFANTTLGDGSVAGKFKVHGRKVSGQATFTLGLTSAVTGAVTASLPGGTVVEGTNQPIGIASYVDAGTAQYAGIIVPSSNTAQFKRFAVSGTAIQQANLSSTTPFTWGSTDYVTATFAYSF